MSRSFIRLAVLLLGSSLFSVMLLMFRFWYANSNYFSFLTWNLFLAWIPLVVAAIFSMIPQAWQKRWWVIVLVLGTWLLFFPNALYIVTDLWHLKSRGGAPIWFDILMLFSFSWNGLILAFLSLFLIHDFLEQWWGKVKGWLVVSGIIVLSSFGVYLGRFLRWNSWDIVTNPTGLLTEVFVNIVRPLENSRSTAFTLVYGVFFWLAYLQVRLLFTFRDGKKEVKKQVKKKK